jgi:hypothetical protein
MIQHIITHLFGPYRGIEHIQTGSQYFGDATATSDWDWVLHVNKDDHFDQLTVKLADLGFELCHNPYTDDEHLIVRRANDNVNLIFTNSWEKYTMWVKCTTVSRALRLNKEQRAVLFSEMIDDRE